MVQRRMPGASGAAWWGWSGTGGECRAAVHREWRSERCVGEDVFRTSFSMEHLASLAENSSQSPSCGVVPRSFLHNGWFSTTRRPWRDARVLGVETTPRRPVEKRAILPGRRRDRTSHLGGGGHVSPQRRVPLESTRSPALPARERVRARVFHLPVRTSDHRPARRGPIGPAMIRGGPGRVEQVRVGSGRAGSGRPVPNPGFGSRLRGGMWLRRTLWSSFLHRGWLSTFSVDSRWTVSIVGVWS